MAFGPHVARDRAPAGGGGPAACVRAAEAEAAAAGFAMGAAALFLGPKMQRRVTLTDGEAADLRALARAGGGGLRLVAHGSYAAPPFGGDPDAAAQVRRELAACQRAGAEGLVIHLPKAPLEDVLRFLPRLATVDAPDVRLFLETPAVVPPHAHYATPGGIGALFAGVRARLDPTDRLFGLCVDTAHVWTGGVDLSSREAAAAWLGELEALEGGLPPTMLHLNDSARPRGRGPDTHEALARGEIWGGFAGRLGESGLAPFVDFARRRGAVAILERRGDVVPDYRVLAALGAGRAPPAPEGGAGAGAGAGRGAR
jgi:endonuclease IV